MAMQVSGEKKDGFGKELRKEFLFDERYRNLNHGSFGTYPLAVRHHLRAFQDQAEARPDHFILYTYPELLDQSRAAIAKFLNVPTNETVFVPNATTGVNTILRNLEYTPNDYILSFATAYGSVLRSIAYITEITPARAVTIPNTWPAEDDDVVASLRKAVKEVRDAGGNVKVALLDTIVSTPGVRMPFERLVEACRELGVMSCVDGAHGVGQVEIDLGRLRPDFFVSNCHKWLFAPRGCAVLYVPLRHQHLIRTTLPTSHGFIPRSGVAASSPLPAASAVKSAFETNFEFVGTIDNAPYLCIPAALAWRESIGGEAAIRAYCTNLSVQGTRKVARMLGTEVLDNSTHTMTQCFMGNVRLPIDVGLVEKTGAKAGLKKEEAAVLAKDWMKKALAHEYHAFMLVLWYRGMFFARLSAQVYLDMDDYEWGGETLKALCQRVERGDWLSVASKL